MSRAREKKLVKAFIEKFGKAFFSYKTEVTSHDKSSRIDMIVYPTTDTPIGIEFKQNNEDGQHRKHGADLDEWMVQAHRYTQCHWPNCYTSAYQRMPIFVVPAITYNHLKFVPDPHQQPDGSTQLIHNNVNSFIFKSFLVGEVRKLNERHVSFVANCRDIVNLYLNNNRWKCQIRHKAYVNLCNQLNITTPCQP